MSRVKQNYGRIFACLIHKCMYMSPISVELYHLGSVILYYFFSSGDNPPNELVQAQSNVNFGPALTSHNGFL